VYVVLLPALSPVRGAVSGQRQPHVGAGDVDRAGQDGNAAVRIQPHGRTGGLDVRHSTAHGQTGAA
jgi:hypothetical protein